MSQIIKRSAGKSTEIHIVESLEDCIHYIKKEIIESIHDVSAYAATMNTMRTGEVAEKLSFFLYAIKQRIENIKLPYTVKVYVHSKTKLSIKLDNYKLSVSLTNRKLKNYKLSLIENSNAQLPDIIDYPVDAFLVAQINNYDSKQFAAFTLIHYKDIYENFLENQLNDRVSFDEKLSRMLYRVIESDLKSIYYADDELRQYKYTDEHRKQIQRELKEQRFQTLIDFSKRERIR